jgi:hypothetical protein
LHLNPGREKPCDHIIPISAIPDTTLNEVFREGIEMISL